jgi:hypothetical protein
VTALAAIDIVGSTISDPSDEAYLVRCLRIAARDGIRPWRTLVAPIRGGPAQIGTCHLPIANAPCWPARDA